MVGFELGGWDAAEVVEDASVVEPVDPFERREFEVIEPAPRSLAPDEFGLVEAVHRLGERVVDAPIGQELVSGRDEAGPVCRRELVGQVMAVSWFVRGGR